MPLGAGPGPCGKRLEKCDIGLEKMKSDLIERTVHLLALQQLYRSVLPCELSKRLSVLQIIMALAVGLNSS